MVCVHLLITFGNVYTQFSSTYGQIVQFLGGIPAAPVFMFLLGVGIVYSKKTRPGLLAKRGAILIASGYILNIFRSFIPAYINALSLNDRPIDVSSIFFYNFFFVDILQFAGLAMLFFAVAIKWNFSKRTYFLTLILFVIANLIIKTLSFGDDADVAPIFALVFGGELSYFPFLTWITYPIVGYFFGTYLIQTEDKRSFYNRIFLNTLAFLIIYSFLIVFFQFPTGYESDQLYYHHTFPINLFFIGFILFWLSCLFFLTNSLSKVRWRLLKSASTLTTEIYVGHFLFIGLYSTLIQSSLGLSSIILLTAFTYLISHYIAFVYAKKEKVRRIIK